MRVQLASLALLAGFSAAAIAAHEELTVRNANHIFNAIHSSMREWDSTLYHYGMSFFLASVPAGTQLYHGTGTPNPTTGMEWLSFELAQAILFAKLPPPLIESHNPCRAPAHGQGQEPLSSGPEADEESGWLHTYAAARDLRLLYIDGLSAAWSNNGTQDSQKRIFLDDTIHESQIVDEAEAAVEMCRILRETWGDRLDGILRMEIGTEVILCSFERDLKFVRAVRAKPIKSLDKGNRSKKKTLADLQPDVGSWLSVASRYHGIGGNRVRLNYDHFVTAFAHDLDIFGGESKKYRPRLEHLESSSLEPIRQGLETLVMTHDPSDSSFNWQAITDMIVE
ncbi:uncharacterized protein ACHE_31145S [Aspergillus chevalieri]|uniref:Uncharacterized protein n=1 Tax=Aspergillus chevalieri TaxID=182096 RepID=A0A7R7VNG6_ASPCH|nr:uncharacterized protein ACHE_31145S [Aspergillus chevalieri]BCR87158.1 hypothetical protein ACHE_31145S [Aspergillus chevalieri]